MKPNEILSATLIDVIFDGRNKAYGAYELRKTYAKRINKALLVTIVFTGIVFGGVTLANSLNKKEKDFRIQQVTEITAIKEEPPPEKLPEPERQPEPEPVRTEQFTSLQIKPDDEVTKPPPSLDDLDSAGSIAKPGQVNLIFP
jgi:protein TonB